MSYTVIVPKPVQKQLDRLPTELHDRVIDKILLLADDPRPSGAKKLKGYDREYRIRIGDYRVRYEIDDKELIVIILHCNHRSAIYRD